jgi:riboflavin kinase/FMN adenylyltransferase
MSIVLQGLTQSGSAVGHQLSFPTINISYSGEESGVFAGKVLLDGVWYLAAVNIGGRPTIDDKTDLCEAFLLEWEGKIAEGTKVKIELLQKIREVKKFESKEDLKNQISKDVEFIKNCYTGKVD